jgi:cellulose synthase/poly-beta-1,6-N-acetylglucosamine synthase-like glycosyltransferase
MSIPSSPAPEGDDASRDVSAVAIVVPAAEEESIIQRLVETLAEQDHDGLTAIVIAVNGGGDATAQMARAAIQRAGAVPARFWRIVELVDRSKTRALNHGERIAREILAENGRHEPDVVLYLDADIELSADAVRLMAKALRSDEARLVQPRRCADMKGGRMGRLVGTALCSLPWVADDVACGGLFAVNRAGRARWQHFPDLGADDAFVFNRFDAHERIVVRAAWATHPMPSTCRGLLRQQRRWREARRELERSSLESARRCDARPKWPLGRRLLAMLRSPRVLASVSLLRVIRIASVLDATPFTSHAWHVDRPTHGSRKAPRDARRRDAGR